MAASTGIEPAISSVTDWRALHCSTKLYTKRTGGSVAIGYQPALNLPVRHPSKLGASFLLPLLVSALLIL